MKSLVLVTVLAGCWTDAKPQPTTPRVVAQDDDYRAQTLLADAVGVAAITGGLLVYHAAGADNIAGPILAGTGGLVGAVAPPIIHYTHGFGGRAGASYLLHSMFAGFGFMAGMAATCAHGGLFCELSPDVWWGIAGGYAVAGAIDALALHGKSSTWTPTIIPSDGGARVGLGRAF
jgi:hypothetical protein